MRRRINLLFILLYLLLLAAPAVAMPFFRNAETTENRKLSELPKLRTEEGFNREYFSELDTYVSEHIGFRAMLIDWNNRMYQTLFGQSPNEKIVVGEDGWLFFADTELDYLNVPTITKRNAANIAKTIRLLQEYAQQQGCRFVFTVAPNKNSIYGEAMPYYYNPSSGDGNWELLQGALEAQGVSYCDLFEVFRAQDKVLYQTMDSHWDYEGARLAYASLLQAGGLSQRDFAELDFEVRKEWEPDLGRMLFAAKTPLCEQKYPQLEWQHRIVSHEKKPDSILLETENEQGSGSVLVFRDSFFNTTYSYFAEGFAHAVFSRAVPYPMDYVDKYKPDALFVEIVERNIPNLAMRAPVMQAPAAEVSLSCDALPAEAYTLRVRERGGYLHFFGEVDEAYLGESYRAYILVKQQSDIVGYEAFPIYEQELLGGNECGDNGFSAYIGREYLSVGNEIILIIESEEYAYATESLQLQ